MHKWVFFLIQNFKYWIFPIALFFLVLPQNGTSQGKKFVQFELRRPEFHNKSRAIHDNIYDPEIVFHNASLLLQDLEEGKLTEAQEIDFYYIMGRVYQSINAKELSRYYLEEALKKYVEYGFEPTGYLINLYGILASTYSNKKDELSFKIGLYKKSIQIAREINMPIKIVGSLNNIGYISYKTGQLDSATYYLDKALAIAKNEMKQFHPIQLSIIDNVALVAMANKDYETAVETFQYNISLTDTISIRNIENYKKRRKYSFINLALCYMNLGNKKELVYFLNEAENINAEQSIGELARYEQKKYYLKLALSESQNILDNKEITENYLSIRDSLDLVKLNLASAFSNQMAKAQLESFRMKSETEKSKLKEAKSIIYFSIVIIIMLIISGFFIYLNYRLRGANRRHKEKLKDASLMQLELQEKLLKEELNNQNKDIKDLTGQLMFLKNINKKINEQLKSMNQLKEAEKMKKLKELSQLSNRSLQEVNINSIMYSNLEEVNAAFYERLEKQSDSPLSKGEKEVIALIRHGLSDVQISEIRATSLNAIRIARFRIKQKLQLDKDTSLKSYLLEI